MTVSRNYDKSMTNILLFYPIISSIYLIIVMFEYGIKSKNYEILSHNREVSQNYDILSHNYEIKVIKLLCKMQLSVKS